MRNGHSVAVIIPAIDEAAAIGKVIADIPDWVDDVVVADNGSTDRTAEIAVQAGARVVHEPRRGYGSACLRAMTALGEPDVVVFLDGDYSDHPEEMGGLVDPVASGDVDLVIGSRVLGQCERGALSLTQRFGNRLSCALVRLLWGVRYSDLGPFRAIRHAALRRLDMRDPDYGWTVEMQVKAAQQGLRVHEVPARYRARIGTSKVSGTIRGVWGAGTKILYTIFAAWWAGRRRAASPARAPKLIVFMRYPEAGRVKTRLIPALGPEGAAELHAEMARHTLAWANTLREEDRVPVEVRFDGGSIEAAIECFGAGPHYVAQGSGDLGARLGRAAADAFGAGHRAVVLVGTDCPEITADIARGAFEALNHHPVVLGPARDGGYYLLGLGRPLPSLFDGVDWGTESVFEQTRQRAEAAGASPALLTELEDVDRPEDLAVWERISGRKTSCA